MIITTGHASEALGVHLQKVYKTNTTAAVTRAERKDVVTISRFSALVEKARACAMSMPDVRSDKVAQARQMISSGSLPYAADVASAMIGLAEEGQV